jgi:hypothetical protein
MKLFFFKREESSSFTCTVWLFCWEKWWTWVDIPRCSSVSPKHWQFS